MTQPHDRQAPEPRAASVAASESSRGPRGTAFARALVLGAVGLAAAGLAHLAISGIGEVFQLPPELAALGVGGPPGPEDQQRISAANLVNRYWHSAFWVGATGAIFAGVFGLTLGMFRRSRSSILAGLTGGVVLGGLFGAAAGLLAVYIDRLLQTNVPEGQLTVPEHMLFVLHAATWTLVGLGIGLGTGLGAATNRWRTAAASMLVAGAAGLLGGVLYPILAGVALPLADTSKAVPEEIWNRLLWLGLPSVLIGLALGRKG